MESSHKTKGMAIRAMEELFTSPIDFFEEFKKTKPANNSSKNVISINSNKTERKLSNRFRDKFD